MLECHWLISKLDRYCPFTRINMSGLGQSALSAFSFLLFSQFDLVQNHSTFQFALVQNASSCQFASHSFDHSAKARTFRQVENFEMLSVRLLCPKETELKVVEKPSVGILSTEKKRLHTTTYFERVGFRHF